MQDLLTITAELIVIVPVLFLALDFAIGLMHLYYACATTQEDKPEEEIAVEPTPTDPKETLPPTVLEKALSRDACNFRQDGLKAFILFRFENLLHQGQKSCCRQRKIKSSEGILQFFPSISAQCRESLAA